MRTNFLHPHSYQSVVGVETSKPREYIFIQKQEVTYIPTKATTTVKVYGQLSFGELELFDFVNYFNTKNRHNTTTFYQCTQANASLLPTTLKRQKEKKANVIRFNENVFKENKIMSSNRNG